MLKQISAFIFTMSIVGSGVARAQDDVAEFYKSNPVTVTVGYSPGGAYDLYARIVARHIGKYIPGHPTVLVQNMPGAGSLNSVNYIYALAKKDGSQIAAFARGIAMQPLLDKTGVKFSATKLNWIGSASSETSVVLSWHTTPFKTIADAKKRTMTVSASGSGADSAIFPKALNAVLGTKFKLIKGYPGNTEMLLAVQRHEVDGNAGTSWSTLAGPKHDWVAQHKINILAQIGLKKHPDLLNVPLAIDLAPTAAGKQMLELIAARQQMAYPFAAPPGVPADRIAALRKAFDQATRDPDFIADAKKAGFEVDPMSGTEVEALVKKIYASPKEVVALARSAVK